jgi:hypothetical protein
MDKFNAAVQRFDKEISEGKRIDAMVDIRKANENPSSAFYKLPDFIMKIIFTLILQIDDMRIKGDDVTIEDLMPTLKFDVQLVNETEGKLENFKEVPAEVLLLRGSKSSILLKNSLDGLNKVLPNVNHVEIQGLDHDSAQNYGKPKRVAQELRKFFL